MAYDRFIFANINVVIYWLWNELTMCKVWRTFSVTKLKRHCQGEKNQNSGMYEACSIETRLDATFFIQRIQKKSPSILRHEYHCCTDL